MYTQGRAKSQVCRSSVICCKATQSWPYYYMIIKVHNMYIGYVSMAINITCIIPQLYIVHPASLCFDVIKSFHDIKLHAQTVHMPISIKHTITHTQLHTNGHSTYDEVCSTKSKYIYCVPVKSRLLFHNIYVFIISDTVRYPPSFSPYPL